MKTSAYLQTAFLSSNSHKYETLFKTKAEPAAGKWHSKELDVKLHLTVEGVFRLETQEGVHSGIYYIENGRLHLMPIIVPKPEYVHKMVSIGNDESAIIELTTITHLDFI